MASLLVIPPLLIGVMVLLRLLKSLPVVPPPAMPPRPQHGAQEYAHYGHLRGPMHELSLVVFWIHVLLRLDLTLPGHWPCYVFSCAVGDE